MQHDKSIFPSRFLLLSFFSLSLIFAFSSCGSRTSKNDIGISGAFALYPLTVKWADAYQQAHPGIRFDISAGGAGKGLADALSGAVNLGMFSREITPAEKDKGTWLLAVAKDAVLPTISAKNPVLSILLKKGLTREQFKQIFLSKQPLTWGSLLGTANAEKINVYTRSDAAGAADTWAAFLGAKQEDLKGVGIFGDPGLADAVTKDPDGIGFNNTIFIYDIGTGRKHAELEVAPIDINGNGIIDPDENFYGHFDEVLKAIASGKYPSPPARQLYFVAKGKPANPAVIAFLKWVLTDGQQFVKDAGYVPLDGKTVQEQLSKLN